MSGPDYSQGGRRQSASRHPFASSAVEVDATQASGDESPETLDPTTTPTLTLSATAGTGQRVDRFLAAALAEQVPGLSRTRVQQWLSLGAVRCDERVLMPATRLAGFETLQVQVLPREADRSFAPDPVALNIVHEDQDVLVIDKPVGLVVHPAAGHWRNTLLNGLLHHRPALAALPRAGIVHRLDKDTSGLLVVAASERALASLSAQLADRSMSRRYLALAGGVVADALNIDAPIGRDPRVRTRMAVVTGPQGKAARTHVHRLAEGRLAAGPVTLVECRLESGRTHQIRVHLSHVGHPLLGDSLYGGTGGAIERQALHAWRLAFAHPDGEGTRHWCSRPHADFLAALAVCGIDGEAVLEQALQTT